LQNKKIWDLLIEPLSAGFNNDRLSDCAEVSRIIVVSLLLVTKRRADLISDSETMLKVNRGAKVCLILQELQLHVCT